MDDKQALRSWYQGQIKQAHRELTELSIKLALKSMENADTPSLDETMRSLQARPRRVTTPAAGNCPATTRALE